MGIKLDLQKKKTYCMWGKNTLKIYLHRIFFFFSKMLFAGYKKFKIPFGLKFLSENTQVNR